MSDPSAPIRTIACCQTDIAWENKPVNLERAERMLRSAALPSGSLVLLPEMFATGFSMHVDVIAEDHTGPVHAAMSRLAHDLSLFILFGVVGSGKEGWGRNQAVLVNPDGSEGARYTKIQPFSYGKEREFYEAGNEIVTFRWHEFTVAPLICYDLRFPELFRAAAERGADLFAVVASWPLSRERHWTTLLEARAIENQAFVAAVNRCGADPKLTYGGRSLIVDPQGQRLVEGGAGESVLRAGITHQSVAAWRSEFPALRDRQFLPNEVR